MQRGIVAGVLCLNLAASAALAAELTVLATVKPVHSLVAGVMAGIGEPFLLVRGGSPHDYALRPSDARALDSADLVFWVGPGLETFMAKPLEALAEDATVIPLVEAEGVRLLEARDGGVWESDGHRHGATDGSDAAGHAADDAHDANPHVWLDPENAGAMVEAIVAALSEADGDNAASYQMNGKALQARLTDLDAATGGKLAPVVDRPFVVFHDAYPYFERRYGLNAVGSITVDPERRPGARRLQEIRSKLAELGAACVFAEPQFEPALVDTVIEGTTARKGVLDPLGADLDPGPDHYFEVIEALAEGLLECLGDAASN